jgi:hypothetical protein
MSIDRFPKAEWGESWAELTGYVRQAREDGGMISPADLEKFLAELRRKALKPVREYLNRIGEAHIPSLAERAYEAYGASTGGRNYQGLPMPAWADLGEPIQQAWSAAVSAVVTELAP